VYAPPRAPPPPGFQPIFQWSARRAFALRMNTLLSRVGGGSVTGPSGAPGELMGGRGDDDARLAAAVSEFWKRLAMEAQTPLGHVYEKVRGSALRDDLASKEHLLERLVQLRKSVTMADDELARLEEQRRKSVPTTAAASPGAGMADAPQPPLSPSGPKSPPGVDIPARRAMLLATEKRLDALTRRLDSMRERLEIVSGIEERVQSATVAAAAAAAAFSAAEAGSGPGQGLGLGAGAGAGSDSRPGPARSHSSPVQASPPKRGLLQGLSAAALAISSGGSAGKGETSSPPPTESLPLGIGQALDSALLAGDLDIDAYVESLSGLATSFLALQQQGKS
jgi:hypothetical protein